jgi:hypothetical protein
LSKSRGLAVKAEDSQSIGHGLKVQTLTPNLLYKCPEIKSKDFKPQEKKEKERKK